MKGKRYKKEENDSKVKKIIFKIIFLLCVITMIISGIKIFEWFKENKENSDIFAEIKNTIFIDKNSDNIEKNNIDFKSLKQINSDTVAFIKVNGTNIEYPIVKTNNNDYYLTHSFNKNYNSAGWVFMDYRNKVDGTDKNMVIYAHNRRDDSLFGTLKNILTEEWQKNKENFIIPFITETEKAEFQVFSVYKTESEEYYITTSFGTNQEFQTFIDTIKARSEKDFGINVTEKDNILTLSTCADNNKERVVLHAIKKGM